MYKRSLAIREKSLGPEHPEVVLSLSTCAAYFKGQVKTCNKVFFAGKKSKVLAKGRCGWPCATCDGNRSVFPANQMKKSRKQQFTTRTLNIAADVLCGCKSFSTQNVRVFSLRRPAKDTFILKVEDWRRAAICISLDI